MLIAACLLVPSEAGGSASGPYPIVPSGSKAPAPCFSTSTNQGKQSVSQNRMAAIEQRIIAMTRKHFAGIGGCGGGLLLLILTPGSESLAQQVRAKFGPSVQIMVGGTIWNGRPGRSPRCGDLPKVTGEPRGYTATLHITPSQVASGENLQGRVVLRNWGKTSVRVDTVQPIVLKIIKPRTREIVGAYTGSIAGTGYGALLAPGRSATVTILGGTGRCDGGIGSALPPGHYEAIGTVSGPGITEPTNSNSPTYYTSLAPLQVIRDH